LKEEMEMLPHGSQPLEVVKGMDLIHSKPVYRTNKETVHWTHLTEQDAKTEGYAIQEFVDASIADDHVLAIWKGNGAHVIAWVEA
jgi:hypothetical protein